MDINKLKEKIKNRIPMPIDIKHEYAVLIPLINQNNQWKILYELRAKTLNKQPGEISFPGGGLEGDESFEEAAIRETMEELNIKRENIQVIGELDYFVTYSNITIRCFLGIIHKIDIDEIEPNLDEVDHIFTVPLDFFLDNEPRVYCLDLKTELNEDFPYYLIPNGKDYNWRKGKNCVHFYNYNDYIIWGFTARMTKQFIDIVKDL